MKNLRVLSLALLYSSLCLAQTESHLVPPQVVVPRLIRFSGQLAGSPGTIGITFSLYKSPTDNAALWMETQNVTVAADGKYSALIGITRAEGIPVDLFSSGEAQWLGVRTDGKPEQPRVLLVSVPYALKAAEAETLAGHSASDFVTSDKVTTLVKEQLQNNATISGDTRISDPKQGATPAAAQGPTQFSGTTTNNIVAVKQSGTGTAITAIAPGTAVYGTSTNTTGNAYGVKGQSASSSGFGVYGLNTATAGSAVGIYGQSSSNAGVALSGNETSTTGPTKGIVATVNSPNGIGMVVQNTNTSGKLISGQGGSSHTEVFSVDAAGNVASSGFFTGHAPAGGGNTAFLGYGISGSTGFFGESSSGYGMQGYTVSGVGVEGVANGSGTGVQGIGYTGYGVYGLSTSGNAVVGITTSGDGVYGATSTASQGGVVGRQEDSSGNWAVYGDGNIGASGTVAAVVKVSGARQVALYPVQSPGVWFEDYGSGQLVSGVASILIDPAYAETVNTSMEYHVFLTPEGECEGLYVTGKTATGFEVHELHQGKSNVGFAYRIIALRRNYETTRLADVTKATPSILGAEIAARKTTKQ